MSQRKWPREPLTGIHQYKIPEDYLNNSGVFDTAQFPDCNVFCVSSISAVAGFTRPDKFKDARDVGSHWHLRRIIGDDGKTIGFCTHTDSAQAGGVSYREDARARMLAGKKIIDVSGGSGSGA